MNDNGDQRGEAFLADGLPAEGPAPAWLDAIVTGRLIAAFVEPPGDLRPSPLFTEREEVAPGRWAVARALGDDADLRRFVAAVRAAARGGRAGVAVSAGTIGARGPLGDAPHDALRLCAALGTRQGVLVDPIVHAAIGGPAGSVHGGRLLPRAKPARRGPWIAALAVAAAVLIAIGVQGPAPAEPAGRIYLFGEPNAVVRSADRPRAFEQIEVAIVGPPGQYASLLVQHTDGRLALPKPEAINAQLTAGADTLRARFTADDRPGTTRFMAVFSERPIADLGARVDALNTHGQASVDALRARLGDAQLVLADPIEHP